MAYTTIDKPTDYFNTVLYTGNASTQSITGLDFAPDFVWLKDRTNANSGRINDIVRTATKYLIPSTTGAEATEAAGLTSFNSDGFSLGSNSDFNGSGANFVSWNWLGANGTSANTDGSISSTVSANTTSGFSIVSFTGTGSTATVGHGLGATPKMFIVKNRSITETWRPYHVALGGGQALALNNTNATDTDSAYWNNTEPTSSVFTVGTNNGTNGSGNSMIAYCFADVKGYSKFGSYTGNGSADGTFVYTGFKPAWLMIKRTDSADAWFMFDNKRAGAYSPNTNPSWEYLLANATNAGATTDRIDLLSNGFKMRYDWVSINESGGSYIYMAIAENPFVTSTGIPTTAR
jgi:hypothetical protein